MIPAREGFGTAVAGVGGRHPLADGKNGRCELRWPYDAGANFLDAGRTAGNFPGSRPSIVSATLIRDRHAVWPP